MDDRDEPTEDADPVTTEADGHDESPDLVAKKPTSEKQISANRRNAQRSTGPTTPEGKARSSRNAETHGAYARELQRAAEAAPDGQVLPRCEQIALDRGREFLRESLSAALQQQADEVSIKGGRPGPVHAATRTGTRVPRPTGL